MYAVRSEYRVKDFLIDEQTAAQLGGTSRAREELLVSNAEGDLELALYLEPKLLAKVSTHGPQSAMNDNLHDFCEVAEGVSHFVYVVHTATESRQVSLLELEAQAEVDKFAMCTLFHWGAEGEGRARILMQRLFGEVSFRTELNLEELERYREANRLAKSYCERLFPYIKAYQFERFLAELRRAYRLGAEAKLQYFARAA